MGKYVAFMISIVNKYIVFIISSGIILISSDIISSDIISSDIIIFLTVYTIYVGLSID